jgi:hypothetical protein
MANVTAGYTWTSGETVTPTKLNSAAAPTVVVADGEVTTAKIADGNVTTAKIADANVTNAKLATGIDASKLTTGTLPIARIADAAVTPAKLSQPLTLATAQNTTSGTSIDFTGIPSWVKRITVMLSSVSTNSTSPFLFQIGDAGGIETSGYESYGVIVQASATPSGTNSTSGIVVANNLGAADTYRGSAVFSLVSGNTWVCTGQLARAGTGYQLLTFAGSKALSDTLDRVRLTTVNGTDTFDAGSVNIMYEG